MEEIMSCYRVYVCPQGHELPSHDPRIGQHLTDKRIPFVLSHKDGVTMGFMDQVNSLASAGMNFSEIEKYFAQHYYDRHWLQEKKWQDAQKVFEETMATDATITGEGIFFIYIYIYIYFFYLGPTYHFRFRHCHSVTRRFPREKGIFFIYIYIFFI